MKQSKIIYQLIGFAMMLGSCAQSSVKNQYTNFAEDDKPPLEFTDADRTFRVVLEISSDSLLTCNNNFSGSDVNPLILDTSNPEFLDNLSGWFASMDSTQISRLKNNSEIHISVGDDVADATIEKVKRSIKKIGIEGMSISNYLESITSDESQS